MTDQTPMLAQIEQRINDDLNVRRSDAVWLLTEVQRLHRTTVPLDYHDGVVSNALDQVQRAEQRARDLQGEIDAVDARLANQVALTDLLQQHTRVGVDETGMFYCEDCDEDIADTADFHEGSLRVLAIHQARLVRAYMNGALDG